MSHPRLYNSEALVLKGLDFGEANRIITLYTPELGKLRVVARGMRKANSKLSGHLEPLTHVHISIARGQNLDMVNQAETLHGYSLLREDLDRLSQALYIVELIDQFVADEVSNYPLYNLLLNTLKRLEKATNPELLVRCFEMEMLTYVGYQPELHWCIECRQRLEPDDHLFNCAMGGIMCPECRTWSGDPLIPLSLNTMKVLRFIQREGYQRASALNVPKRTLMEAERLMRTYIRYTLDRDVKAGTFMNLVKLAGSA